MRGKIFYYIFVGYSITIKINIMKIQVGTKFRKYYNPDNFNNIDSCEVRGVIDDFIIVLWCKKQATSISKEKSFYMTMDKYEYDLLLKDGIIQELNTNQ